ncbi:helix-turn-helix domain-containing protein [Streptomyces griseus]|uniref:sigma factor n=1 Tax=Streptomyces griseus TaxID=1911 RepID=UPI0038688500|nr:helix-turn-helix domain-containing protein [Streptomyces fimicarius]
MSATQTVTPTVTTEMIRAAQGGDSDAMWDVISAYEPMLRSTIRKTAPAADREDVEDLLQDARVALMECLRSYDTDIAEAAGLNAYARRAVQRVVADGWLAAQTSLSVEPGYGHRVKHALWLAGGDADAAWITVSSATDPRRQMSREAFMAVCEALVEAQSLDTHVARSKGNTGTHQEQTLADTIPDTSMDVTASSEARDTARYLLSQIPPRQAYALRAFYGVGMTTLSDEQASDELGLSSHGKFAALRQTRTRGIQSARSVAAKQQIAA